MAYYIGPRCSACHYCFNECPVGAIRFAGTSYEIDEFKCIGCGKCAEVCPAGIIYDPENPVKATPHEPVEKECDIVVLGAGGSGLVSAVRAAQLSGKKVIVVEKAKKPGGNTTLGHGFMMRYTKWHEAEGIPDTRQSSIDSLYEQSGKVLDYEMLTNATYALSDMFDWLCTFGGTEGKFVLKKMGPGGPMSAPPAEDNDKKEEKKEEKKQGGGMNPFAGGPIMAMIDFPNRTQNTKCTDTSMGPGWMGTYVVEKMLEVGKEQFGMEVLCGTAAKHLLTNDDGSFAGVVCEDEGGTVTIKAKACVIATGGFAHNDELMKKTNPGFFNGQPVKRLSVASSTGDGMELVKELGGAIDLERVRVPASGPVHHPWNYTVFTLAGHGNLQVDVNGNTFNARGGGPGNPVGPLDTIEGGVIYQILDMDAVDRGGESGIKSCTDPCAMEERKNYREAMDKEAMNGWPAKKAWTIEGLAEKIGCEPSVLQASIDKYNAEAEEEAKNPKPAMPGPMGMMGGMQKHKIEKAPFYAIKCGRFSESASGGIVTDTYLRVAKEDGSVIPGIFAVGDSCRGLFLKDDTGGKFGEMPWAMASGFLAGKYASEYVG